MLDNFFTGRARNLAQWTGHPHFTLITHDITGAVHWVYVFLFLNSSLNITQYFAHTYALDLDSTISLPFSLSSSLSLSISLPFSSTSSLPFSFDSIIHLIAPLCWTQNLLSWKPIKSIIWHVLPLHHTTRYIDTVHIAEDARNDRIKLTDISGNVFDCDGYMVH